jgi:hypothetical protein
MRNFIIKLTGQEEKKDSSCCGVEIKVVEENSIATADDSCCESDESESKATCCR